MDDFPTVMFVSGDVEAAGHNVRLRIEVDVAQGPIDLRLPRADLSSFVNLLLLLGTQTSPDSPFDELVGTVEAAPLPLRGVSLGTADGGETLLLLEVGAAVLALSLPLDKIGDIGRALLEMSAPSIRRLS